MFVKWSPNAEGAMAWLEDRKNGQTTIEKSLQEINTGNRTNIKVTCYFDYYYNFKHCKSNFRLQKSVTYADIVLHTVAICIQHLTDQYYNLLY